MKSLRPFVLLIAVAAVGAAQSQPTTRTEYVSTAKLTTLLKEDLFAMTGKEAQVIRVELEPGWVGDRHYHTGDVFVYVEEGQFGVDVDGEGRKVFNRGEVYHEALNTVMQARNLSATSRTKLVLFQVSNHGEPLMIVAPSHPSH
jgi:quercetin dioxygenase-like cupin family protein